MFSYDAAINIQTSLLSTEMTETLQVKELLVRHPLKDDPDRLGFAEQSRMSRIGPKQCLVNKPKQD